ncbi:sulfite exporter TauE/SafE family protein [Bacillus sp. FJAT-44742]|uniref:sulfite exporter TauE/SafE family protein n=1 Tax=Bacillus sp. FJAT-44742 TaxID=2014005 RepID=UPI000C2304AE|nr:sulfite exporter TauE/SafE family protein [Bacillus sp. FJAT-44742]
MAGLHTIELLIVIGCAILIGISKTGLPTLGIFVVAVMATVFPARDSIGIVLPMLITADIIAVAYYRRSANWKLLFRLVPWVLGGLAAGFIFLFFVDVSRPIEVTLGSIVVAMAILQLINDRLGAQWMKNLPDSVWFTAFFGTLAGFTTMAGNAAGPIMALFLLSIGLQKKEFIGTGAWFFLTVNLIKVPLYVSIDLITMHTLTLNAWMIPAVLLGTLIGITTLKKIPQRIFEYIILALAFIGGIRLLVGS